MALSPDIRFNGTEAEARAPRTTLRVVRRSLTSESQRAARVLIVDDEPIVLNSIGRLLTRESYRCSTATSAAEARVLMRATDFDLVLCDVNMPEESGLDFVRDILEKKADIAVIMITGLDDPDIARTAIEVGAYGYIIKPFRSNEILINISNALCRRALEAERQSHRDMLSREVQNRAAALEFAIERLQRAESELRQSQEETIQRLSKAAEFRDNETAQHIERMSRYCS